MSAAERRFTTTAQDAQNGVPRGIRRAEGWALLAVAVVQVVCLAVLFQAQNLAWGGFVLMLIPLVMATTATAFAEVIRRIQGVHPRSYTKTRWLAVGWMVLVIFVAGPVWMSHPHHTNSVITSGAALVAVLPGAVQALLMIRRGR